MPEDNQNIADGTLPLDQALYPYFAQHSKDRCYPALVCHQGNREMVQINVPAYDIPTLLQSKPSINNDPDSGKNRPVVAEHAGEIKEYIRERVRKKKPWVLGTITANIDPSEIQVIRLGRGMAIAVIPRNVKLDITDGQHRVRAIDELARSEENTLIGNDDFPITLVLEGDFKQCQVDFRDMAQTRPLAQSLLRSFGEYEGVIGIVKNLIESVPMFAGKTEKIKKTPSPKQKCIYTINYIGNFVSCAFADDPKKQLKDHDVEQSSEALTACCNQFFSQCNNTKYIFELNYAELTSEDIIKFQGNCILTKSVGLEVLGRLLYNTYDEINGTFDLEQVARLSQLDWSMSSPLWRDSLVRVDPNPKNPAQPYKMSPGRGGVKLAVSYIRRELGWLETV
ncbi:DNA sulfur modification protein DndB [Roseofilum casamattae]|uniref:DNA sulfur modification protein DndB n=1 Tax=Roseofilum casamattae BLCC-M143 TaxID=3022442 RepID=A0ABT7C1G5_9CYAN|nr:DNA sulfur modification protein DndB [Roseofilum casamattae]MDJ1185292.1 DNA sulfur modification protein DndB [Roseofilum casamattae BLCC-M143]